MEFANVKYITFEGKSFFIDDCQKVPHYEEARKLRPVIVDDFLKLKQELENIALLRQYIKDKFLLVPIRRQQSEQHSKRRDFPLRVLLEITSKCNLKCIMCPRNALKRPEMHMPKDVVLRCIDEIDNYGVEGFWLYYIGEVLLHPDFEEIFNYCQKKKNLGSLWLSTNGQELTNKMINTLIDSNLTFLNYSLTAMNSESYHLLSPLGNYESLVFNLERLLAKKQEFKKIGSPPWIRVQMIDQPQVFSEIDHFLSHYSRHCEILSVNVLESFSQNFLQNIDYVKQRKRPKRKYCNRIQRGDCFIFSDGGVSICDTDFNHEMSMGNIYNSTIEKIWSGNDYQRYKLLNESGRLDEIPICRSCLDYDL